MFGSWRCSLITALATALALLPGPALALDPAELEELESLLRDLGFDPGAVDGVVDDETIEAIRRYQEFAALPGEPEPSALLLSELRGVAAAFAALSPAKEETSPPAAPPPDSGADQSATGEAERREEAVPEATTEKVVVPPPPPPPKLKPAEPPAPAVEAAAPAEPEKQEQATAEPAPEQTAELPPAQAALPERPAEEPPAAPPGDDAAVPLPTERPDPEAAAQARIDAQIAPFRILLNSGRLSREELANRFNDEGREAMQNARYNEAILKFSVAIQLNPNFAGAYSNRGTAYQRNEEADLAAADFAKAKQLGFGSMRIRDGRNPFN